MLQPVDPSTRMLTGDLPFTLLLAAILTWPIAVGLLALYRRAVRRSMSRRASVTAAPFTPAAPGLLSSEHPAAASLVVHPNGSSSKPDRRSAEYLLRHLLVDPWRVVAVYAVAGCVYALIMAWALLVSDGTEILPMRLLMLFWLHLWPVVLTVGIVAASVRGAKVLATVVYFIVWVGLGALAINPDITWGTVALLWGLFNLPATLILLTYLGRPVRAVGPLVLTFLMVALLGSDVAVLTVGSSQGFIRAVAEAASRLGLGAKSVFVGILLTGFAVFALAGGLALSMLRRRYEAKRLSDESLTIDSLWLLFTAIYSISFVFGHPVWVLAGIGAFIVFKACVHVGFALLRRGRRHERGHRLLLLRSFSIGRDSERLFNALQKHWRRVGSIQLIAGVDLARGTVEPHEFLDFISGRLSHHFIQSPRMLEQRMKELDTAPDRDGRFRVNDFFCYDDTWKMVLSRLVHESDAVLMDLRGFSPRNAGCVFEIHELVNLVALERVVFITDDRTDEPYLRSVLGDAARAVGSASPNRAAPAEQAGVFRLEAMNFRELRRLLWAMAVAVAPPTAARA